MKPLRARGTPSASGGTVKQEHPGLHPGGACSQGDADRLGPPPHPETSLPVAPPQTSFPFPVIVFVFNFTISFPIIYGVFCFVFVLSILIGE